MSLHDRSDSELGRHGASGLLDVLIRAGLILALAMLCYQVFAPFLTLMVWALKIRLQRDLSAQHLCAHNIVVFSHGLLGHTRAT